MTSVVGEVENVGVRVQVLTKDMVEQSRNNVTTVNDKLSSALGKITELLSVAPNSKELIATQEVIQSLNANIESAEKAIQAATVGEELNLDKTTKAVADVTEKFFATVQKLEDFKDTDIVAAQNAVDQASEILNQAAEEPEKAEEIIREENKPVPTVEPSKKYEPVPVSMPTEDPIKNTNVGTKYKKTSLCLLWNQVKHTSLCGTKCRKQASSIINMTTLWPGVASGFFVSSKMYLD